MIALLTLLLTRSSAGRSGSSRLASDVLENVMPQGYGADHQRGRVYSLDVLVVLSVIPVGYLLARIAIDVGAIRALGADGALICSAGAVTALFSRLATKTNDSHVAAPLTAGPP